MERSIYKYPLQVTDSQIINLPIDYKILTVQEQNGIPCMWGMVDYKNQALPVEFVTYGTGHPVERTGLEYISTYQLPSGLVFHVFKQLN